MSNRGMALMGVGTASGELKAVEAAQRAISSPLLDEISITGATGILINVTGNSELKLYEVNEAATLVQEEAHEDAEIIFGWVIDDTMGDEVRVTVIATGFEAAIQDNAPNTQRGRTQIGGGGHQSHRHREAAVPAAPTQRPVSRPVAQQRVASAAPVKPRGMERARVDSISPWATIPDPLEATGKARRKPTGESAPLGRRSGEALNRQMEMDLSEFDRPTYVRKLAD